MLLCIFKVTKDPELTLVTATRQYLHEVLGIATPQEKPWAQADALPYFLKDAFQFAELELLGHSVVLAIAPRHETQTLGDIRTRLDKVRGRQDPPVVFVTDALASYERKRLIEQKVPFIVPGNQLYLPDLGLDLREYFRQRAPSTGTALSPSTQAILIAALMNEPLASDWQPARLAADMGYTSMTLSRAVRELNAAGLVATRRMGRSQCLHRELPPQEIWEKARPLLRSPVRRTVWAQSDTLPANRHWRLAGLSALASASMLAEPRQPVYALSLSAWREALKSGTHEMPEPSDDAQELQLWNYDPALVPDRDTVDPLSLILSLQDSTDDRVLQALDELKAQLPW